MKHAAPALLVALWLWAAPAVAAEVRPGRVEVPPPSAKALRFFRSGQVLWVVGQAWNLAVPAALLATGLSARLRTLARRIGRSWFGTIAVYAVLYLTLNALIDFPLTYYAGFVRPNQYGLGTKPFPEWLGDACKRLGVGLVMAVALLWIPYGLIARSPRRWWIYTGVLVIPFILSLLLLRPIVFDPLFNDFGPMKDRELEVRILRLAERAGIEGGRVFEVDKSRETKTVNAYVTGFLDTKRIVLWDTLLARLTPDEVLCVMGHEMGHYVLGHVLVGTLMSCGGAFCGLAFVHFAAGRVLRSSKWTSRFGFDELKDVASFSLLILLGEAFFLVTSPLSYAVSRHMEHEADRFALEITRDNHACATAFVKLQLDNLSHPRPGPIYKFLRATHPPIGERIDFSNDYRPWELGEPGRYEQHFHTVPRGTRAGPT